MTFTASAAETEVVPAAVTVSEKVRMAVVLRSGAVKVGAEGVPLRVTVVPAVCVQEYTRGRFPGSELAPPASVTAAPSATVWSAPAFAVGASPFTVTSTASAAESETPSFTVSENVRTVSTVTSGAVNVGAAALAELSVTAGVPPVCVHA